MLINIMKIRFRRLIKFFQILIIIISIINSCESEQRFLVTPPSYQEVSAGEDVRMVCKVHDKKGQCIWQKDRKPIGMYPDKYEWASGRGSDEIHDADCTLRIRKASLEFDDGIWECQVTPGDFTRQDALTSLPSRLLIKVKPRQPRLEYGGTVLTSGSLLTLREGQEVTISCVSRYGNPPALIKWFIGGDEVEPLREQTNATEVDSPKTWAAHSLLRVKGDRENHDLPIRCLSLHPTNPLLPAVTECRLNVHYSPEVRIETSPRLLTTVPEDSSSFMSIKCLADANPSAVIRWYKDSVALDRYNNVGVESLEQNVTQRNGTAISGSEIRFEPVKRHDAGLYTCKAVNIIGESASANYRLDVQYGPRLKVIIKSNDTTTQGEYKVVALLGSNIEPFECDEFEANPSAYYRWLHLRGGVPHAVDDDDDNNIITSKTTSENFKSRKLRLKNVIWADEGEYRCIAYNIINGVRREMASDIKYILHVSGPPQIQTRPTVANHDQSDSNHFDEYIGWIGDPAHVLKSKFCSRPPPKLIAWQWGSSHIRAGENIEPKYEALPLEPITENNESTNCYWAKLVIHDLHKEDARIYSLLIESEKGHDSTNLKLIVRDPMEIKIIAIAGSIGVLIFLVVIALASYSLFKANRNRQYRKKTCRVEEEEDEDGGQIAADAFYTNPTAVNRQQKTATTTASKVYVCRKNVPHEGGGLAVMYDYNQIVKNSRALSPEALKVRRAPAVLQPPTIV